MNRNNRIRQASGRIVVVIFAALWMGGTTFAQSREEGLANFYSDGFQGKKMANGELYDKDKLTASHKKHPFGTKLKVTNIDSGKSVVVTVTDRMAQKPPVLVDVTRRAADELGFTKAGKTRVKIDSVQ